MINKYLERKVRSEQNGGLGLEGLIELEYYLIECDAGSLSEPIGKKVYGISVLKRIDDICCEEEIIRNFSCCIHNTQMVINKLANNLVTPITLKYVLDDLLAE